MSQDKESPLERYQNNWICEECTNEFPNSHDIFDYCGLSACQGCFETLNEEEDEDETTEDLQVS